MKKFLILAFLYFLAPTVFSQYYQSTDLYEETYYQPTNYQRKSYYQSTDIYQQLHNS